MAGAELTFFMTPTCPVCRALAGVLEARGIRFRSLDVSADRDALVLLMRYAGRPIVPTIVAYGEVMVGFDASRLEHLLEGLEARAEVYTRRSAEEDEQIRESEAALDAADKEEAES